MKSTISILIVSILLFSVHAVSVAESLRLRTQGLKPANLLVNPSSERHLQGDEVQVNPDCGAQFNTIKRKHAFRFVIFGWLASLKEVGVERVGERRYTYDNFLAVLPPDQPRFAVFDYEYTAADGSPRSKLLFIDCSPDDARVKDRKLYAGFKDSWKRYLPGFDLEIKATDFIDIDESVVGKIVRGDKFAVLARGFQLPNSNDRG